MMITSRVSNHAKSKQQLTGNQHDSRHVAGDSSAAWKRPAGRSVAKPAWGQQLGGRTRDVGPKGSLFKRPAGSLAAQPTRGQQLTDWPACRSISQPAVVVEQWRLKVICFAIPVCIRIDFLTRFIYIYFFFVRPKVKKLQAQKSHLEIKQNGFLIEIVFLRTI